MFPVFSADSKSVLSINVPKLSGVRDAVTGKEVKATLPNAADAVGVQVPGPKDLILFPMLAGESVVWNLKTGAKVAQLPTGRRGAHHAVAFATDASFVVTAYNGHLCRWNLPGGEKVFGDPAPPGPATAVSRLVFSPDGQKVFCLGEGDVPGVWNVADRSWAGTPQAEKPKPRTDAEQVQVFFGNGMNTQSVAFPASGPRFLTGGGLAGMDVRDGTTGKSLAKLKEAKDKTKGPFDNYNYGQLSADGATATVFKMNYTGNQSRMTFETWDVAAGTKSNFTEFTFPNYASLATLSPCGRFTLVGGKVVVISSGSTLFGITKNPQQQYYYYGGGATAFSADGRVMATSQNEAMMRGEPPTPGTIHLWDVVTGKELRKVVTGSNANVIAFSADNRLAAFAGTKGVKVFDLSDGKELKTFSVTDMRIPNYYEGFSAGSPLAFAPDGRTLATGHLDGTVTVWAVPKPADLPELKEDEFEKFWAGLANEKADSRADVYRLLAQPDAAVRLLNAKFVAPPHKPLDVDLSAVIRRLDAPAFPDRLAAIRKLRELGPRIAPALHDAVRTTESVEIRTRAEELLDGMKAGPRTYSGGPDLRASRAVEVLERVGSADAKRLLQGWANHTTNVRIANEAALALVRIAAAGK